VATVLTTVVATNAGHTAPKLGAYLIIFVIAGLSAVVAIGLTLLIPTRRPAAVQASVQVGRTP
jgi:hypothetical protein